MSAITTAIERELGAVPLTFPTLFHRCSQARSTSPTLTQTDTEAGR